ncbi:MAG: hypothetical protein K0U10_00420 [Gammaproteobacteria bacterium]|nr:hypothetical protein [Gammaproteobacteria bacterium]
MVLSVGTFCFYFKPDERGLYNVEAFTDELNSAFNVISRLTEQALLKGNTPPHFTLQYFLLPQESEALLPNITSEPAAFRMLFDSYLASRHMDPELVKLEPLNIHKYDEIYFNRTSRLGDNIIDFMKVSAMKNHAEDNHLQLDTNSVIHDFEAFYGLTFGSDQSKPQFIANVYSRHQPYFTVNSKVVYLPAGHDFTKALATRFAKHLSTCLYTKNQMIYNEVFCETLKEKGFLNQHGFIAPSADNMECLQISRTIFVRVLKTWREKPTDTTFNELPALNLTQGVHGADCLLDAACFKNLVQKYSTPLLANAEEHEHFFPVISFEGEVAIMQAYCALHPEACITIVNTIVTKKPRNLANKIRTLLDIEAPEELAPGHLGFFEQPDQRRRHSLDSRFGAAAEEEVTSFARLSLDND